MIHINEYHRVQVNAKDSSLGFHFFLSLFSVKRVGYKSKTLERFYDYARYLKKMDEIRLVHTDLAFFVFPRILFLGGFNLNIRTIQWWVVNTYTMDTTQKQTMTTMNAQMN